MDQIGPTLGIALFINVYSWLNIMKITSLHAPNHAGMGWFPFVTSSWTMDRPVNEVESTECQFQFSYEEVIPCANKQSLRGNYPVYEMKCIYGECLPYESIVELRADKI